MQWYYVACTACNKPVKKDADRYSCAEPGCNASPALPGFCLPVDVTDVESVNGDESEPFVRLILYGPDAERVVGTSVDAIIAAGYADRAIMPDMVRTAEGKSIEARVSVSKRSFDEEVLVLQVVRLFRIICDTAALAPAGKADSIPGTSSSATPYDAIKHSDLRRNITPPVDKPTAQGSPAQQTDAVQDQMENTVTEVPPPPMTPATPKGVRVDVSVTPPIAVSCDITGKRRAANDAEQDLGSSKDDEREPKRKKSGAARKKLQLDQ